MFCISSVVTQTLCSTPSNNATCGMSKSAEMQTCSFSISSLCFCCSSCSFSSYSFCSFAERSRRDWAPASREASTWKTHKTSNSRFLLCHWKWQYYCLAVRYAPKPEKNIASSNVSHLWQRSLKQGSWKEVWYFYEDFLQEQKLKRMISVIGMVCHTRDTRVSQDVLKLNISY